MTEQARRAIEYSQRLEVLTQVRRRLEPLRQEIVAQWKVSHEPSDQLLDQATEYIYLSSLYLRLGAELAQP